MAEVCVDASFALKLVLPEPDSHHIAAQWALWDKSAVVVVAPWLWLFESHAVLRRKVTRGEFTEQDARKAWRILQRLHVQTVHPRGLFDRAWQLATTFHRPTTYDAVYMATADLRGCDLWTADQRLINAVTGKFPRIRTV